MSTNSQTCKLTSHDEAHTQKQLLVYEIYLFLNFCFFFFEYEICIINEIIYQLLKKYGLLTDTLYWTVKFIFLSFHCKNLVSRRVYLFFINLFFVFFFSFFIYFVCLFKWKENKIMNTHFEQRNITNECPANK